jgi:protein-S-isoprenylcysteine O-methyltransferase Ste14
MRKARWLSTGGVVLYFVIALEVLIMISPFAAFFYAVMNPVLLALDRWPATRWLDAFFLPHLVVPPGPLLATVRVLGSVIVLAGGAAFLGCAAQVYGGKLLRRGPATRGLYAAVRHPQYLALAVAGLGLAILWPRFLTLLLWGAMVGLYDLLARDEEWRMLAQHGDAYRRYQEATGRFLPRGVEALLARRPGLRGPRAPGAHAAALGATAAALALLCGLGLRAYTVSRLPFWSDGAVWALPVLPGDGVVLEHRLAAALALEPIRTRLAAAGGAPVLVYVVPPAYVMQGMIADTGPEWRLYQRHQTAAMIADWILHPFRHLEGHHAGMQHGAGPPPGDGGVARRLIFLRVTAAGSPSPAALLAIGAERAPLFLADVDLHALEVQAVRELPPGSGWGRVPTPLF